MSEYCSLSRGADSYLWNDVSLCSPLYQHEQPLEFGSEGSNHSSLSPSDTVSGSFWGHESPTAGNEAYDDANLYSVLQAPDSKVLGDEFLDEMMSLDNYLHSNSSNSCDGLEDVETLEFSNLLSKPFCADTIDAGSRFDFTQKSVVFTPKEEPSSPTNDTVELNPNVVYDITNTDERTIIADDLYLSKLRRDHLKRKRDSRNSNEYTAALIVKLSPRSENSASPSIVPKHSYLISDSVVESPRTTYTAASQEKAAKVRTVTKNSSTKASINVHSRVSGSDDDEDDSQNDPTYNRAGRVVRSSKKTRACNITLEENKNAVQARINREKKKAYISDLEQKVTDLESENTSLKKETKSARSHTGALVEEVAYLKAVLANQSALAQLLKNINGDATMPALTNPLSSQVNLSNNGSAKKRRLTEDHDYGQLTISKKSARGSASTKAAGVCLHVSGEHISLEMCRHCSLNSDARME